MDDVPAQEVRRAVAADPHIPAQHVAVSSRGNGAAPSNRAAMPTNIIGLGLIVAGIIFMIMGGVVGWIIGVICLVGGIGALFLTYQRRRAAS